MSLYISQRCLIVWDVGKITHSLPTSHGLAMSPYGPDLSLRPVLLSCDDFANELVRILRSATPAYLPGLWPGFLCIRIGRCIGNWPYGAGAVQLGDATAGFFRVGAREPRMD